MKCTIVGCTGEYEGRHISQTYRLDGRLVVVDDIPAEVCSVCGDILLTIETSRRIHEALHGSDQPVASAPVYRLAVG